jgi:hypothetical protein
MDPRIQIRIRIHTKMSWIRNTGLSLWSGMERSLSYSPVLVKTVELEGIVVDIWVPARNHQLIIPKKTTKTCPSAVGTENESK